MAVSLIFVCSLPGCSTPGSIGDSQDEQVLTQSTNSRQWLEQRKQLLNQISNWRINARFSFVTNDEAWSGKLDWLQQSGQEYLIHFSDPAGQGAMQLLGNEQWVELRLANGESYQAKDADELLKKETDWELPIGSLWHWIRAVPDPGMDLRSELNPQGLPAKFEQDGWTVNYHSYHEVDQRSFPRKIIVEKDELKLKLIIMNWILE